MASKVDAAHVVRLGWHLTRCRRRIAGRVFEQKESVAVQRYRNSGYQYQITPNYRPRGNPLHAESNPKEVAQ